MELLPLARWKSTPLSLSKSYTSDTHSKTKGSFVTSLLVPCHRGDQECRGHGDRNLGKEMAL